MAVDPGILTSFDLNDTTPITTNTGAVVLTLTAESLFPQGSVGGTPTVSSSDTSIATVSASAFVLNSDSTAVISDITITGVAIGTSTITVSFTDPGTVAHSVTATVTVEAPDYLDQSGLRHFWDKIKSLFIKNENGAVTTDLLANSAVTTAKINASAITNAKLATAAVQATNILDGAVTSDKIDWKTLAPYWKTVATSTSSSVTLPAGYRLYRVRLIGNKTGTGSWGVIWCSQATGTTWIYIQGMSDGTWIAAERSVTAPSDKAIMDGARSNTASGLQSWDITISKQTTTGTECMATWETSTGGSLTFNTGRSIFNVTSGTANLTLNSEMSSAFWSVEALVES